MGNPSIEQWRAEISNFDSFRQSTLRIRLFGNDTRPILFYGGAYGEDYEESFIMFAEACQHLRRDFNLILTLHPRVDGSFERKVIQNMGLEDILVIANISTVHAVVLSDIVVVQRSTVGIQALFVDRPSIYLDVTNSFKNVGIYAGISPQVTNVQSFLKVVQEMTERKFMLKPELLSRMGIPPNPVQRMLAVIDTLRVDPRDLIYVKGNCN